jgi:hypothetical protein
MGAAVNMYSGCSITGSTVTTFGNCGSNVTPLLSLGGNNTLVRRNHFHNGCTIYSARSVVNLLWESTVSHYYGHGGAENPPPLSLQLPCGSNNSRFS